MLKRFVCKVAIAIVAIGMIIQLFGGVKTAHAAKGDRGTDQSVYQGASGRTGYGDETFQINQIGGYYNGSFIPHWTYATQTSTAIARGLHAHTYIYSQFSGRWQADQMLNYYLPRVQTPKGSIVALDVESGNPDTDSVLYALHRVQEAGYTAVLYGYKSFLTSHLDMNTIADQYPIWMAQYPDYSVRRYPDYGFFPSYKNIQIFQFTSTYIAGGLDGNVDLTGITDNGYKGGNVQKPVTQTPAVKQGQQIRQDTHTYTVQRGDSWWAIANRYGMDMNALAQLNGKTIQSVIYPGQVLRVADSGKSQTVNNKVNKQPTPNNQPTQVQNWDYPFNNWNNGLITSNFGMRNLWGQNQFHDGVDIASNSLEGQPVKAIHSGKVVAIGRQGTTQNDMGTYVVVESPDGYSEVYQEFAFSEQEQQRSVAVHVGDEVKTGDTIATMYYGGYPHVNHIHIGVYRGSAHELLTTGERNYENPNSNWVDPMKIIANNGKTPQPAQSTGTYTVQRGDSWWAIANRYGMDMNALAQLNGKTIQSVIYPGQVLRVADKGAGQNVSNKVNQTPAQPANNAQYYTVRRGDSFWAIANRYGMNMYTLAANNGLSINSVIYPGQRLKVSGRVAQSARPVHYVRYGETLSGIAASMNTTVDHLQTVNGIRNANLIYVGQRIAA